MENSHTDFLQEVEAEIAGLKERITALEQKLEAFRAEIPDPVDLPAEAPAEDTPVDFTDIDLEEDTLGPSDLSMTESIPDEAPVIPDDTPVIPDDTSVILSEARESPAESAPDETASLSWRKDKPGMQVKNIRSGISLYDRALFIGTLFKEDFSLYDKTIADLNDMVSLDQAVDYIREHFPAWNLKSDVVYNFMMAVRKKLG